MTIREHFDRQKIIYLKYQSNIYRIFEQGLNRKIGLTFL